VNHDWHIPMFGHLTKRWGLAKIILAILFVGTTIFQVIVDFNFLSQAKNDGGFH